MPRPVEFWVLLAAAGCMAFGCAGERGTGTGAFDKTGAPAPVFGQPAGVAGTAGTGGALAAGAGGAGDGEPLAGSGGAPVAGTGGTGGDGQPMAGASGMAGMAGMAGAGGGAEEADPVCELPGADAFQPNDSVGPGGSLLSESDHFRIYGSAGASNAEAALNHLEAAHRCFVEDWCFRSPGRSVHTQDGPHYQFNVYAVGSLGGAAGVMQYDAQAGISYLEVIGSSLAQARVTVHEFGHALTLTEYGWVDQTRTGAWWETVANWVADTYLTSAHCADARDAFGVPEGNTLIDLNKVISQAHMLIVSDQNYYEAWPFLTYLTQNPDGYPGLGRMTVPELFRNHAGNDETPLHVLERVAAPVSVQTILGRYWARMAYLDIGHPKAAQQFFGRRDSLDFANLDALGAGTYQVKTSRQPAYGGANIIPLSGSGDVSVQVTNLGNGQPDSNFTATLAIRSSDGSVRYVDLPDGSGSANLQSGEEASLVVVNTPDTLYLYNAFTTTAASKESAGLNYRLQLTGAVPAP